MFDALDSLLWLVKKRPEKACDPLTLLRVVGNENARNSFCFAEHSNVMCLAPNLVKLCMNSLIYMPTTLADAMLGALECGSVCEAGTSHDRHSSNNDDNNNSSSSNSNSKAKQRHSAMALPYELECINVSSMQCIRLGVPGRSIARGKDILCS